MVLSGLEKTCRSFFEGSGQRKALRRGKKGREFRSLPDIGVVIQETGLDN